GAVIVLLPILVIQSFKTDVDRLVGSNIVNKSIGYYALWLGVILSVIGSFKAISYPPYLLQGYNHPQTGYPAQPQGYQKNQQTYYPQQQYQLPNYNQYQPQYNQQNQQPAVQPPSYINPEPINPPDQPLDFTQPISVSQVKNNFCGNCGYDNEVDVKFCVNCGTKFDL
ncbi:MAG: zinc ribbon domain-containing protein, partial [Candidatus Heimdallarchaeota archaeon]